MATKLILQPLLLRQRTEAQQNRRLDTKRACGPPPGRAVQGKTNWAVLGTVTLLSGELSIHLYRPF